MQKVSADEFLSRHEKSVVDGRVYKGFRGAPSYDKDTRTARFTMSAEVEDRDGDIILVAGIDTTNFEKLPTALIFHASRNWPIGLWSDLEKVLGGRPKRLEGTLNLLPEGVEEAADKTALHLQYGTLGACSIGFVPDFEQIELRQETREDGSKLVRGFLLKAIDLVECSPVPVPANPMALVKAAEGGKAFAAAFIEEVLDTYAKDPKTGMLVPRAAYEAAYKEATGERTIVQVSSPAIPVPEEQTELSPPQARSLLRRAFDLLVGTEENEARLAAQMQAEAAAEEEVARIAAAEKAALIEDLSALESRLAARGIGIGA